MVDYKISELDPAAALVGDELIEVVQSGSNKRTTVNTLVNSDKNYIRTLTSGVISGCTVTINADPTKIDIAAGEYLIVDCWTDVNDPVVYPVIFPGATAVTVTNLNSADFTNIALDKDGNVVQQVTTFDAADRRDYVELVQLGHTSRTSVSAVVPSYEISLSPIHQLRDLFAALGIVNKGNALSPNGANLSINKAAGTLTGEGVNEDPTSKYANVVSIADFTAPTIRHRTQTGEGAANSAFLDVGNYDVGGTLTALVGVKYTNQRVYMFSNGNMVVQYGQNQYNTMGLAVSSINSETFIPFGNVEEKAVLLGIISVRSTATDLSNTAQATFSAPPSGGSVGAPLSTLQSAYDNSTEPEIVTNAIQGAVSIKRGSSADTDNILEGKQGDDTTTFSVKGNGAVAAASFNNVVLTTGGASTAFLNAQGNYTVPAGGGGGAAVTPIDRSKASSSLTPVSGDFVVSHLTPEGTATQNANNRLDLCPVVFYSETEIDLIGVVVSTAAASAVGTIGIYDADTTTGYPTDLLYTSTELDFSTTGYKSSSATFTFEAGKLYWIAMHMSGLASLRTQQTRGGWCLGVSSSTATTYQTLIRRVVTYASGLPDPWVYVSSETGDNSPYISYRMRVV